MTNHVPIHTDHEASADNTIGKVFHAQYFDQNGVGELRSQFYIPNSEAGWIQKLESGVLEEVSVGTQYKHLNCSECGWDFMGSDATEEHIWSRTCANDHHIGTNGVHLILNGLDRWLEQSLVPRGAAQGAKIVARTKALLGQDTYNQLAASGKSPAATILFASATPLPPQENSDMDLTELVKQLTDAKVLIAQQKDQLATLQAASELLPTVQAQLTAAQAEVATLRGTDAVKLAEEKTAALGFIRAEAVRVALAAGDSEPPADANFATLSASIEKNRKKLQDIIPIGGRSEPQGTTGSAAVYNAIPASFKTRR